MNQQQLWKTIVAASEGDKKAIGEFDNWLESALRNQSQNAPLPIDMVKSRPVHWLWRMIVRAAPTCTLYSFSYNRDVLIFRFWPRFEITGMEIVEYG